jgi:hypothetical protein
MRRWGQNKPSIDNPSTLGPRSAATMQTNGFGRPATVSVAFLRIKNMWSLVLHLLMRESETRAMKSG